MCDEEIIRNRLLIDGDGTGDDRRLNILLKQFLRWVYSKTETPEENVMIYNHLMSQLALCKFAAVKTEHTRQMLDEELLNYKNISANLEKNIEMAKQEIKESKGKLIAAKQMHLNNLEYDKLAKVIKQQPDRKTTQQQIETLQKEMVVYNKKKLKLESKFKKRQKDCAVLMCAVSEMEAQLDTDNSDEDEAATKGGKGKEMPSQVKNSTKLKGLNGDDNDNNNNDNEDDDEDDEDDDDDDDDDDCDNDGGAGVLETNVKVNK